jgi:hypothetical protein
VTSTRDDVKAVEGVLASRCEALLLLGPRADAAALTPWAPESPSSSWGGAGAPARHAPRRARTSARVLHVALDPLLVVRSTTGPLRVGAPEPAGRLARQPGAAEAPVSAQVSTRSRL